jgi:predicted glycosyltransferase
MFFLRGIKILRESGHELLCTSREYREAVELARLKNLDLKIVGAHGGADRFEKLVASANRIQELADIVNDFKPTVAITFSSPEAARVAYGLGINHIGFNDSPHAEAVGRLTVPLMNSLYTPWVIPYSQWIHYGISRPKIHHYRALDPAAWLKDPRILEPDRASRQENAGRRKILIRMEETKAAYIADKRLHVDIKLIDSLIDEFSKSADIVILCRYQDQIENLSAHYDGRARIMDRVVDGTEVINSADIFIGGGGTMTTEAALMGKPAISIAPLPYIIEDYLEKVGLVKHVKSSSSLLKLVKRIMNDKKIRSRQERIARRLLESMEDPTDKIVQAAESN